MYLRDLNVAAFQLFRMIPDNINGQILYIRVVVRSRAILGVEIGYMFLDVAKLVSSSGLLVNEPNGIILVGLDATALPLELKPRREKAKVMFSHIGNGCHQL